MLILVRCRVEKFALACQSLPSEHFDNVLERRVFNLSVTSECLAPFYVTAHLPNKVRVLYLEVCIAYKSPSCQMAACNLVDWP